MGNLLRELLDAGGRVHGVSDYGVVEAARRTDATDMTGPELILTPIRNGPPSPSSASQALNAASLILAISRAASTARSAWSSEGTGAPKAAMMPSPM